MGISDQVVDKYFTNTVSRVGGITLEDIQADLEDRHRQAFDPLGLDIYMDLPSLGTHKFRSGPQRSSTCITPRPSTCSSRQSGPTTTICSSSTPLPCANEGGDDMHLRSLLEFNYPEDGIPLEEVESVESIVRRFKTAAMSYGALSAEAHECLAIAMNRLGGKSNTGEGGEDESRYGTERNSAIKQVASARFGVTSKYLVSAQEIRSKWPRAPSPARAVSCPAARSIPG